MGFCIDENQLNAWISSQQTNYDVYAPMCFEGGGRFSGTDCIRYGKISSVSEIVFDKKSEYSFKEILTPISQTLFYFTDDDRKEPSPPKKGAIIFLRSCDLHAVKRLDDTYLKNGPEDSYYSRIRENIKFVLMGCKSSFENCFCVSMGSNISENYDMSIDADNGRYLVDCKDLDWNDFFKGCSCDEQEVQPRHVDENKVKVTVPENLAPAVSKSKIWDEYNSRCINCGRCNFACPTCTCFTMQDLHYSENKNAGERRRIWAGCMVNGFTDVAGGGSYRKKNGERMRFKVLHKVLYFRKRNGYNMCVGCGRCDDICPEYISFSNCVNKLENAMKEVCEDGTK